MKEKIKQYWQQACSDWNYLFKLELKNIVKDEGVLIFFFLVPLAYPLLYSFIYTDEVVREVPIAAVDESHTTMSREYLRHVDASPDVKIINYCADMAEAERCIKNREAYGIVRVPADFSKRLSKGEQVEVGVYSDMSGMLYYKSILTTNTNVSLAMNARIKVARAGNTTEQQDLVTQHPIAYDEVSLYNPQNGFASFLIPAVLILIIQQTLLLGVGISAGTAREQNRFRELTPFDRHHTGLLRIVLSKSSAYMLVYIPISVYILGVVPRIFHLNQIGNPVDMALFIVPFLLACTFFAMTVSGVIRQRNVHHDYRLHLPATPLHLWRVMAWRSGAEVLEGAFIPLPINAGHQRVPKDQQHGSTPAERQPRMVYSLGTGRLLFRHLLLDLSPQHHHLAPPLRFAV